jgi:hypothetical protein
VQVAIPLDPDDFLYLPVAPAFSAFGPLAQIAIALLLVARLNSHVACPPKCRPSIGGLPIAPNNGAKRPPLARATGG